MWIEDMKDTPVVREILRIAGRDQMDRARRLAMAKVIAGVASARGIDVPDSFADDLASYADEERLLALTSRIDDLQDDVIAFVREIGGDFPTCGGGRRGSHEMIEASEIDYEKNPIFRRPFELGRSAERRSNALNLLDIARPGRTRDNQELVEGLPEEKLDGLIAAVSTALRARTAEALTQLDETIDPQP